MQGLHAPLFEAALNVVPSTHGSQPARAYAAPSLLQTATTIGGLPVEPYPAAHWINDASKLNAANVISPAVSAAVREVVS